MMQQPVFQQEQASNQVQQQQQMLLCPVRLVYETQILVQPGDQIQPNQTIVINPQNQPPWAQNRVQNQQVIYVQNMQNSYMPQVHQLDQNQMFLQQNYGFPQVIQHPMITQNQEQIRSIQMGNVPANMQSQMQANIAQIMPNERIVTHNYGHMQVNPGINVPSVVQNQIANVPISANNRQIATVPKTVTDMSNNSHKPQEVQISTPQNYRNVSHHPIAHQMNLTRAPTHQTVAMIPVPNVVHRAPNLDPNTNQINSVPQQAIVQTSNQMPPTFASPAPNIQIEPRKPVPIMQKGPNQNMANAINHTPKNQTYSYRPIQPRPQQFRSNVPANAMTVQPNMNIQIQPSSNIVESNRTVTPNIPNQNYQKVDNSHHQFNRKRKSESPDDLQRKLTIVPTPQPTPTNSMTVKRIDTPTTSNSVSVTKVSTHEIGVNTNPIVKSKPKTSVSKNMIQINPLVDQNAKIKEELAKPIQTAPQILRPPMTVTNITNNNPLPTPSVPSQSSHVEREKLVRSTVFTQARYGRVLADKQDVSVNKPVNKTLVTKETENVDMQRDNVTEDASKAENVTDIVMKSEENNQPQDNKTEERPKNVPEVTQKKPEIIERCAEEKMLSDSMNRLKGSEANELKLKNERDYILTHVLDGFVIQESNVAFPIRLPLKEKTLGINTGIKMKAPIKEDLPGDRDTRPDRVPDRVPDLSHLNLSENERLKNDSSEKKELHINEGNPFTNLKHAVVKSWKVEQLSAHLSKFNWLDTISVLREHEIDGESLFLVSKSQLVSIGVKENHADVICEFVKS